MAITLVVAFVARGIQSYRTLDLFLQLIFFTPRTRFSFHSYLVFLAHFVNAASFPNPETSYPRPIACAWHDMPYRAVLCEITLVIEIELVRIHMCTEIYLDVSTTDPILSRPPTRKTFLRSCIVISR